jgi:lipid A 3-O-deacylase
MLTASSLLLFTWLNFLGPVPRDAMRTEPASASQTWSGVARRVSQHRNALSFRWENDAVARTDRNYTNGMSLTFSRDAAGPLGRVWTWFGAAGEQRISGYEIGQIIITPADIGRASPDPEDRPYAGLLYGAVSTQLISGPRMHGLKLITGVVGPAAGAERAQKAFHRLIGDVEPQGWDHQLKNEPILNAVYEYRRRYLLGGSRRGWSAQAIPRAGGMFGNVLIQAQAAGQFRVGYNMPDDFGTSLVRGLGSMSFPKVRGVTAHRSFGLYVFGSGGANLVARNLTLDGNTFRDGPRVQKRPLFPGAEFGLSLSMRRFETTLSYVFWGREYETQPRASQFGSAVIGFRF